MICIGLCLYKELITIYLPKDVDITYNHNSTSGSLNSEVLLINGEIKSTSGDITLISIEKGAVSSTSGNIEIEESQNIILSSTIGDITLGSGSTVSATARSGNIEINQITNQVNAKTTSGDITLESLSMNEDSTLEATSGNIKANLEKEVFIDATTRSGDIDINNKRESRFNHYNHKWGY